MKTTRNEDVPKEPQQNELDELARLTPFDKSEVTSEKFARGNMLGGANPLESAAPLPAK